jgi:hypothetical protein
MRDANGRRPPWQALAIFGVVAAAALRRYFISTMDPDGKPPLRARIAAHALPVAACFAAARPGVQSPR